MFGTAETAEALSHMILALIGQQQLINIGCQPFIAMVQRILRMTVTMMVSVVFTNDGAQVMSWESGVAHLVQSLCFLLFLLKATFVWLAVIITLMALSKSTTATFGEQFVTTT